MRQFMGHNGRHSKLAARRRHVRLEEHGSFSIGDQTKVLHGTGGKIWDCDHIGLGQREWQIEICNARRI